MSDNKRVRLQYDVQRIDALKKLNDEFLLVKIYAMASGKNRNFTYISKEDIINAIPSAYYCPVVGHIRFYVDVDGNEHSYMGGHDIDIDEHWEIKDATRPYGVIVEGSENWETVDEHGKEEEYLTFNAILWIGRYPELEKAAYSDEILFNQSIEINIENYRPLEEDSNYWEVLGFKFSAFCLLGKADEDSTNGHTDKDVEHTEPAFINAKVVPYEFGFDEFKQEFSLLKDKISKFVADVTVNTTNGGDSMAEEFENVDTAVTEFEDASVEPETADGGNAENTEPTADDGNAEADAGNVTEEETQTEESTEDTTDYQSLYNDTKAAYEAVVADFEAYKKTHSHTNEDYAVLETYRSDREKADREMKENALFSSFADGIGDTDEYANLKSKSGDYSLGELEMRLYAIVGKYAKKIQPNEGKTETMRFSLGVVDDDDKTEKDPYGNAREYYL